MVTPIRPVSGNVSVFSSSENVFGVDVRRIKVQISGQNCPNHTTVGTYVNDLIEVVDVGTFGVDDLGDDAVDVLRPRQRARATARTSVVVRGKRRRRPPVVGRQSTAGVGGGGSGRELGDGRQAAPRVVVPGARRRRRVLDARQRRQLLAFVPRQRRRRRHRRRRRADAQRPLAGRPLVRLQQPAAAAAGARDRRRCPVRRPSRTHTVGAAFFGGQHLAVGVAGRDVVDEVASARVVVDAQQIGAETHRRT